LPGQFSAGANRHQGRAKSVDINLALTSANPLASLLKLGEPKYHERLVSLKREIDKLRVEGTFGTRHYHLATRDSFDRLGPALRIEHISIKACRPDHARGLDRRRRGFPGHSVGLKAYHFCLGNFCE
jgi:hypothetical protein